MPGLNSQDAPSLQHNDISSPKNRFFIAYLANFLDIGSKKHVAPKAYDVSNVTRVKKQASVTKIKFVVECKRKMEQQVNKIVVPVLSIFFTSLLPVMAHAQTVTPIAPAESCVYNYVGRSTTPHLGNPNDFPTHTGSDWLTDMGLTVGADGAPVLTGPVGTHSDVFQHPTITGAIVPPSLVDPEQNLADNTGNFAILSYRVEGPVGVARTIPFYDPGFFEHSQVVVRDPTTNAVLAIDPAIPQSTGLISPSASVTVTMPAAGYVEYHIYIADYDGNYGWLHPDCDPNLGITKSIATPASVNLGTNPGVTDAGDQIVYEFVITNSGATTMTNVAPTDSGPQFDGVAGTGSLSAFQMTALTNTSLLSNGTLGAAQATSLHPGDSATFQATYTLTTADVVNAQSAADPTIAVVNIANVAGTAPGGGTLPAVLDARVETGIGALLPIDAIDDTPPTVESALGATIPSVVANDTLGGVANPTIGTSVTVNGAGTAQDGITPLGLNVAPAAGGITLNPTTGEMTVAAGTTVGTYVYTYEICDVVNPTNCDTANITVVVGQTDLIAEIEEDLIDILEEDLANTLTMQSSQISGYSADAVDRLRNRSHDTCLANVNERLAEENILFDTDKAIIKPESSRTLDEIAVLLSSCPGNAFEIAGHTDSDGSDAYNIDLSQRRVDAVLDALSDRDLDTAGYIARGYGESKPIASNATLVGKARNRRVEFRPLTTADGYQGPCEDSFSLARSFNAHADGDSVNTDLQFLRDQHDCITDRREVFEATLSYIDTKQGQTQSAINLSYRREQYRGSDSVFGYFIGLYGSQSDVTSRATGDIRGVGVNAGIYGANRLPSDLFLDYYLGAAAGRHDFDLSFDRGVGTIYATGDYQYVAGFAGLALSGEVEYGETTVAPRVGFDYVYTPGADVDVVATLGGLSQVGDLEIDAISGGRLFAELGTDHLIQDGNANLWINPRISCYQSLGSLDGVCGFGGSIGIESVDEESDLTYAYEVDGEWGEDYSLASMTLSASRRLKLGAISGTTGLNSEGNVTMGARVKFDF